MEAFVSSLAQERRAVRAHMRAGTPRAPQLAASQIVGRESEHVILLTHQHVCDPQPGPDHWKDESHG